MFKALLHTLALLSLLACSQEVADPVEEASFTPPTQYAFVIEASEMVADNVTEGLRARIVDGQLHVTPLAEATGWRFALETTAIGCGEDLRPVGSALAQASADRVELDRGTGLVEWFVNTPRGIEQGYSVSESHSCAAFDGRLIVEMRAEGLEGELVEDDVLFRDPRGAAILSYAALHVEDADGATVSARLSARGDRVRIEVDDRGARYPLMIDPLITNEQATLLATGRASGDQFGASAAVSGDTMVIGAPGLGGATTPGAVFVFVRAGGAWSQQQRLEASGTTEFGRSVAIDGDTIVVGAPFTASFAGAAYVFVRAAGTWSLEETLPTTGMPGLVGTGVAISGNTALVGAEGTGADFGAARLFTRSGTTWTAGGYLFPSGASAANKYGASVAFDGTIAVVGATRGNSGGMRTGLAHVFRVNCFPSFEEETVLAPADGLANGLFGAAVAVSGDTVIVGAPDHTFANNRGAAYVYTGTDPTGVPTCTPGIWTLQNQLTASDAADNRRFGSSVALDGQRVVVGASGRAASIPGSGYYFTRTAGVWSERSTLVASDPLVLNLGVSAAIGADFVAAGASSAPGMGTPNTGAVFVFDTTRSPNGGTCTLGTECTSGFCVDGFCCDTACGGGSAMDCQACSMAAGASADGVCTARVTGGCDDGSTCTTADTCGAAGCTGTPVVCTPSAPCRTAACVPATGLCAETPSADGATCDDGDGCTVADSCLGGTCTSGASMVCTAVDDCHLAGVCDSSTGVCSEPPAPDGTTCSDDDACTATDMCAAGACVGSAPVVCMGMECNEAPICDSATGTCNALVPLPDGTACAGGGMCSAGACRVPDGGMGDGGLGDGGGPDASVPDSAVPDSAVPDGGAGDAGMLPDTSVDAGIPAADSGCGCHLAAPRGGSAWPAALSLVGFVGLARRRRRRLR